MPDITFKRTASGVLHVRINRRASRYIITGMRGHWDIMRHDALTGGWVTTCPSHKTLAAAKDCAALLIL